MHTIVKRHRPGAAAFFLFLLLLIPACAKKEMVRPEGVQIPHEEVTADVLLRSLDFSSLKTVRSAVRFSIRRENEFRVAYSGILFYRHPDRMNLRVMGPFGITVMEVLFNAGSLQVLIPSRDLLFFGRVPFGRILPDRELLAESVKVMKVEDDMYVVNVFEEDVGRKFLKARYFFSRTDLSWKAVELYSEEGGDVRIENYKTEGIIPSDMGIYIRNTYFHLELKDMDINKELGDERFAPLVALKKLPLSHFLDNYLKTTVRTE
jgi:hypothetical protein